MGFKLRNSWGLWLAVVFTGSVGARATAQQITVQVYNRSAASPAVLRQGEAEAERILADAGVEVAWLNCPNSSTVRGECVAADDPNEFVLRIVSQGKTSTNSVFGEAFLGEGGIGKYCDIFFGRIEEMHRDAGANVAQLLGAVAAHELGHLLLGSNAHSPLGIMEPVWQRESLQAIGMGTLLFTRDQAAMMKARAAKPVAGPARVRPAI